MTPSRSLFAGLVLVLVTLPAFGQGRSARPIATGPTLTPELQQRIKRLQDRVLRMMDAPLDALEHQLGDLAPMPAAPAPAAPTSYESRLGARLSGPGAALIDQLDLPRGQGLLVGEVDPNSPAAKAGLKANDILLELDGKPVPSEAADFRKQLDGYKVGTKVDLVVMRRGVRQTVKGLELADARPIAAEAGGGLPVAPLDGIRVPGVGAGLVGRATLMREDDQFTIQLAQGGTNYTVSGKATAAGAQVSEVVIEKGDETNTYAGLSAVPEAERAKVKELARVASQRVMATRR